MKITLRKANALQNAIQEHIKTIDVAMTLALNEFQDPEVEIANARARLVENDQRRANLTLALYAIRGIVGNANATSGVSVELARAAYIDKRIGQLKGLVEAAVTDSLDVVKGKLRKIAEDKGDRSFYRDQSVNVGVVTQEQVNQFRADLSALKKEKQSINDKVLELNIRTEIVVVADVVAILQAEQLI
mgnify:CR=1 FL=1